MDNQNPETAKKAGGGQTVFYVCEHCDQGFAALGSQAGQAVECPNCNRETVLGTGGEGSSPGTGDPPRDAPLSRPAESARENASATGEDDPDLPPAPKQFKKPTGRGNLTICRDCGQTVSVHAEICPHCGLGMRKKRGLFYTVFWGTVSLLATLLLIGAIGLAAHLYLPDAGRFVKGWFSDLAVAFEEETVSEPEAPPADTSGLPFPDSPSRASNPAGGTSTQSSPPPSPENTAPSISPEEEFARALELAKEGDAAAQETVGYYYETGRGIAADPGEAFSWYMKAAMQGSPLAQSNIGNMWAQGSGRPQDYKEAVKWYRKAAEQGLASAQFNLGVMYDHGYGVPQDLSQAFDWYLKAAESGAVSAQLNVAMMYFEGQGTPLDFGQAYRWAIIAAEGGNNDAVKLRDALSQPNGPLPESRKERIREEARQFLEEQQKKNPPAVQ